MFGLAHLHRLQGQLALVLVVSALVATVALWGAQRLSELSCTLQSLAQSVAVLEQTRQVLILRVDSLERYRANQIAQRLKRQGWRDDRLKTQLMRKRTQRPA